MRLLILSCLRGRRVTYHTTQAECVRAHPRCSFLLGSSLHPRRPAPHAHPSNPPHPLPHEMCFLTLVMGQLAEHGEQRNRDDHSFFPQLGTLFFLSHTNTHELTNTSTRKPLDVHANIKKRQQTNRTFSQVPLKFSSENAKCCTQTYKIPMINIACPTVKSIVELCCIGSTKPHICRQSWRVKPRLYLLKAN